MVEEDNLKKHRNNQLIRCSCGNILAGYDESGLNVKKKGRVAIISSHSTEVMLICERCGQKMDFVLDEHGIHWNTRD